MVVAIRKGHGRVDPGPAFRGDGVGLEFQLFRDQPVEKRRILEPAAVVALEEIAQHDAARSFVGRDAHEQRPPVRGAHRGLGQHPADRVGLLRPAVLDRLPDLLLAGMVFADGERHQLLERHGVLAVDLEERGRDGCQTQALFDDLDVDEEGRGDRLLGHAGLAQGLEGAELIERMQGRALDVLGQRQFRDKHIGLCPGARDDAGHRRGPGQALLFDQQLQRPEAAAAGRNLVHAGVGTVLAQHRADMEGLDQPPPGNGLGKFLDRNASLDAPDVRLAQNQPVEGNVAR